MIFIPRQMYFQMDRTGWKGVGGNFRPRFLLAACISMRMHTCMLDKELGLTKFRLIFDNLDSEKKNRKILPIIR